MTNIKFGTFNVNGLRDTKKRNKIFNYLHQRQINIAFLQETHSVCEDEKIWKSSWGGLVFYSHGSSESRGVAIMIKKKCPIQINHFKKDAEGRICMLLVKYEEQNILLVNIYAPNKDKPEFFLNLFSEISKFENDNEKDSPIYRIIAGDFNLVLNLDKDKLGGNYETNNKSAAVVRAYLKEEGLIDVWRYNHLDENVFTFHKNKPKTVHTCIDYIITSDKLCNQIKHTDIAPTFLSDHDFPTMVIVPFNRDDGDKGRGIWRLNTSLLQDKHYESEEIEVIKEVKTEKLKAIKKWEWLKYKVRKHSKSYAMQKSKDRENRLLLYEKKLKQYNAEIISIEQGNYEGIFTKENTLEQKNKLEKDREELINYKVRGAKLRAKADWLQYGEKMSSYYFKLENANYKCKNRYRIYNAEKKLVNGPRKVLDEQKTFYQDLFTLKQPCNKEAFTQFTKGLKAPNLSEKEKELLEADITLDESMWIRWNTHRMVSKLF